MAFGDIGGAVTELIITCRTPKEGTVGIAKGDAVKLTSNYTITNETDAGDPLFGQAMAATTLNDQGIPIKVRGICVFNYVGFAPTVDGKSGVAASGSEGSVIAPGVGLGKGINVMVDVPASQVHVLL